MKLEPLPNHHKLQLVQPLGRVVYRPTYASKPSDPYSMTSEQWKEHSCTLFPDKPYAVESITRISTYVEDRGVDWEGWYYLFLLSLPRRKVVVEETAYYERDLFCDGSKSEERLVHIEKRDLEEHNQASLFGVEGYLEWTSITIGLHIDLDDREFTHTRDKESSPDPIAQDEVMPHNPASNLEPQVTLGEEHFADIPVRARQDNLFYHLHNGDMVNYVVGKELSKDELPQEFLARGAGLDADRYKIVDVKQTKVYDDRPTDRYTYRITVREMLKQDKIFSETTLQPE